MLLAKNKKALYSNELVEKFTAGIVLYGHEVKAIREKSVNFEGSYIKLEEGIPVVVGLKIGRYSKQSKDFDKVEAGRTRQLLLNKNEVVKLATQINQKGKTAVPMALITSNNLIKLELAVVKGLKKHEAKAVVKDKQVKKDLERETKNVRRSIWG